MNTRLIDQMLVADPATMGIFQGTLAYDQIPTYVDRFPAAYVFNTEPSYRQGEHWVALYLESPHHADYFDSYGTHPFGDLYDFAKTHVVDVFYNHNWIQGPTTAVCGQYCIYFLHFRCRGMSMENILSHFDPMDKFKNDVIVYDVVQALLEE